MTILPPERRPAYERHYFANEDGRNLASGWTPTPLRLTKMHNPCNGLRGMGPYLNRPVHGTCAYRPHVSF